MIIHGIIFIALGFKILEHQLILLVLGLLQDITYKTVKLTDTASLVFHFTLRCLTYGLL